MPSAKPKNNDRLRGIITRYNWIRRMLLAGVPMNCNEIAEQLGCTAKTAQRHINRLRADGYEIFYEAKTNGFYCLGGPEKPTSRQSDLYIVLRQAYVWAIKNNQTAPWVDAAREALSGKI